MKSMLAEAAAPNMLTQLKRFSLKCSRVTTADIRGSKIQITERWCHHYGKYKYNQSYFIHWHKSFDWLSESVPNEPHQAGEHNSGLSDFINNRWVVQLTAAVVKPLQNDDNVGDWTDKVAWGNATAARIVYMDALKPPEFLKPCKCMCFCLLHRSLLQAFVFLA